MARHVDLDNYVPRMVEKVLNLNCQNGNHDKCKGKSKGTKNDPVTFICTCECHKGKRNESWG